MNVLEGSRVARIMDVNDDQVFVQFWSFAYAPRPYDRAAANAPCLRCDHLSDPATFVLCTYCNRGGCLWCFDLDEVPRGDWCCGSCQTILNSRQSFLNVSDEDWSEARIDDLICLERFHPSIMRSRWVDKSMVANLADMSSYAPRLMVTRPVTGGRRGQRGLVPIAYNFLS